MASAERSVAAETPDNEWAFPRLSERQIELLAEHGERRRVNQGDVLIVEGDAGYDFYVVLEGKVAILEGTDGVPIAVHGPGRFLGELGMVAGQPAFFTAVVIEPGEVLAVPVEQLRLLATKDTDLGDLVLRACLMRREQLVGLGAGLRIVGSRYSPDTRRLREFAARNRLPHRWIDLDSDPEAEALLRGVGVEAKDTPVVIWRGEVMRNPSSAELAKLLRLRSSSAPAAVLDLIVVGAGPAGLAASVYGASEGLETMTLDSVATGGQAATSSRIENYLGFPTGISGAELADRATLQAEKFGAQINVPVKATRLEQRDGHYGIALDDGTTVAGRTILLATGAHYRRLQVPRLEDFEGTSVYYAATWIEAQLCAGDPVAVVGGGNSAGQATLFLAGHAAKVWLLIAHSDLNRDMSRYLADRIERHPLVEVLVDTEVREPVGERQMLEGLAVENNRTGERHTIGARALFVFIGAQPCTGWLRGEVALDDGGYVLTGPDVRGALASGRRSELDYEPLVLETSRPGVLAVGDVRTGSVKRVASAVGEGSMAVRLVHEYLGRAS